MERMEKSTMRLPLYLQLFADGGNGGTGGDGANAGANAGAAGAGEGQQQTQQQQQSTEKTFTQTEVNGMMANEKRQGKASVLKELGFEDMDKAKAAITAYNQYLESQKTQQQKDQDAINTANQERDKAKQESKTLQQKLDAIKSGVKPEAVDDLVALAASKVDDSKDFQAVLEEMKKNELYASFFQDGGNSNTQKFGTGANINTKKQTTGENKSAEFGKRLAQSRGKAQKSAYFKN